MFQIYTGLALWNLAVLTGFAVLAVGQVVGGWVAPHTFQLLAFFMAFFCCLVHCLLIAHFIGSMKWIQQSGPTAGIEDTKKLRTAWIKGRMYPILITCMLLAVATAILSGGAFMGSVSGWIPAALAFLSIPLNAYVLVLARRGLLANRARMDGIEAQMEHRIASGEVKIEEEAPELLPESGRAGGKTLLFLSINVWVLYVYFRYVLRQRDVVLWPFIAGSLVLAFLGWRLLRGNQAADGQAAGGTVGADAEVSTPKPAGS
jgi:hypothetical protein